MNSNSILKSTKEYSLKNIFTTNDRKIIIPDFQRDYCWGDKNHGKKQDSDIVPSFLETLKEESKTGETLLGKIDVYENPKNHIYLTDGQQRLTTLYLLIGMLYKKTKIFELKQCLISDYEETQDDKEPYLQYAIRESSLFFVRDLVNEFFIAEGNYSVEEIENQPWFFNEYTFDPTIISMLKAMIVIEKDFNNWKDVDFETFSEFIINDVKIQYYDVQDRKHGEERFVIINTTGKSLEQSETLKPILLGKVNDSVFSEQWEERETWFWQNRNKKDKEQIADNGVEDFLYWCFRIVGTKNNVDLIKDAKQLFKNEESIIVENLKAFDSIFKSLNYLLAQLDDEEIQNQFKFVNKTKEVRSVIDLRNLEIDKQENILLPLLSYISKFNPEKQIVVSFLRRLRKNFFDKEWSERNHNYVDWRHILQIIEKSSIAEDVLTFSNPIIEEFRALPNSNIANWYNEEEKIKAKLKIDNKLIIEEWEDNQDFMGDLSQLLKMTESDHDIKDLKKYYDTYKSIQIDNFNFTDDIYTRNVYRLYHYIKYGKFEHRGVAGYGYCMLIKSDRKLFLEVGFDEIWQHFYQGNELHKFLNEKVKSFFKNYIIKDRDFNHILEDITRIGHYERVLLWSVMEFLYSEKELNFKENICQFWEYPNLIKIEESGDNNYSIGNLLLGTSYYNNKSGWIYFTEYPLMKSISNNRKNLTLEQINLRSLEIKNKLIDFII